MCDRTCLQEQWVVVLGACRTEDGDLRKFAVRAEHVECVAHLGQGRGHDLQIDGLGPLAYEIGERCEQCRGQFAVAVVGHGGDERGEFIARRGYG